MNYSYINIPWFSNKNFLRTKWIFLVVQMIFGWKWNDYWTNLHYNIKITIFSANYRNTTIILTFLSFFKYNLTSQKRGLTRPLFWKEDLEMVSILKINGEMCFWDIIIKICKLSRILNKVEFYISVILHDTFVLSLFSI